jgi:hypothetical protein
MGIQILLNECEVIAGGDQRIVLAGIDDAHFYRVDDIEKAALQIPNESPPYCYRTHRKFTARPHTRISI